MQTMILFRCVILASFVILAFSLSVSFKYGKAMTSYKVTPKPKKPCPKVIRRNKWLAERADYVVIPTVQPDLVVIHTAKYEDGCYNRNACSKVMKFLQHMDMVYDQKSDIAYNFCLGTDGGIYEGRGWRRIGQHAKKYNNRSIGICIIGNPDVFTEASQRTLQDFLQCSMKRKFLAANYTVVAHNQIGNVECPEMTISMQLLRWGRYNHSSLSQFTKENAPIYTRIK